MLIVQFFGWCVLVVALAFVVFVWLIHSKGRSSPWVRAVSTPEIIYVSKDGVTEWKQVVSDALTDGLRVDEIVFRYRGSPRILLGIQAADVGPEWKLSPVDPSESRIRVTVPGDEWQKSLATSEVLGAGPADVPESFKKLISELEGVSARWETAEVRLRAAQVVIEMSAEIPSGYHISPRWVEALRMVDSTLLYVIAAAILAAGAVLTLTGAGIAFGVVVFVALSGVCKFIFMSRRSDPTREEYLQNY